MSKTDKSLIDIEFVKINLKRFSSYTLTGLLYDLKPVRIYYMGNMALISCKDPSYARHGFNGIRQVKNPDLTKYQEIGFKVINSNYYVAGWNHGGA